MTEKPNGGSLADKVTWVREKLDRQRAESRNDREHGSGATPSSSASTIEGPGEFMSDVTSADLPSAVADQPQADAMQPAEDADAVKKRTHDVDTDDMFDPSA